MMEKGLTYSRSSSNNSNSSSEEKNELLDFQDYYVITIHH
jgi:hypothetical protein